MVEFFRFPFPKRVSQRRLHPLEVAGERISFVFLEVGCRHRGRRAQLKNKKELFLKYWGDQYISTGKVDWTPQIFRILSHYNEVTMLPPHHNKFTVDALIQYDYIPEEQMVELATLDRRFLYKNIKNESQRELIIDLVYSRNGVGLQNLVRFDTENKLGDLRGFVAEELTRKLITSFMDKEEVIAYMNPHIAYGNRRFQSGTQVDQVLQFYGTKPFYDLLEKLSAVEYISVSSDTPPIFK